MWNVYKCGCKLGLWGYSYFMSLINCIIQNVHWMDLLSNSAGGVLRENERKRLEAVWELFQSETVFLIDHLMVLKHVCIISLPLSSIISVMSV